MKKVLVVCIVLSFLLFVSGCGKTIAPEQNISIENSSISEINESINKSVVEIIKSPITNPEPITSNKTEEDNCWKEISTEINGTAIIVGKGNLTVTYNGAHQKIEYLGFLESQNKMLVRLDNEDFAVEEGQTIKRKGTNIRFDKIIENKNPELTKMEVFTFYNKITIKDCTVKLKNPETLAVDLDESTIISQSLAGERIYFTGLSPDGLDATLKIKGKNVTITFGGTAEIYDVKIYFRDIFMNRIELFMYGKDDQISLSQKCACPTTKHIDCMPAIDKPRAVYCSNECAGWWRGNCDIEWSS